MEQGSDRRKRHIGSLEAAKALFAPVFARALSERLYIAHLNAEQRLIGIRIRYAAERQAIDFPVRDIIADAVALGTAGLILAHNHPSGDPAPSPTDIDATRRLAQVARPIGITIRDHLVFGGGRMESFRRRGLL